MDIPPDRAPSRHPPFSETPTQFYRFGEMVEVEGSGYLYFRRGEKIHGVSVFVFPELENPMTFRCLPSDQVQIRAWVGILPHPNQRLARPRSPARPPPWSKESFCRRSVSGREAGQHLFVHGPESNVPLLHGDWFGAVESWSKWADVAPNVPLTLGQGCRSRSRDPPPASRDLS